MNDFQDMEFVNIPLYFFEDKTYQTGGKLSVDVSSYTKDQGKTFSSPKFYFKLRNLDSRNRSFSLDYFGVMDLIESLVNANFTNPKMFFQTGGKVVKEGYNISLVIHGQEVNDTYIVLLQIVINDSDLGKIAIPFQEFKAIFNFMIMFKENWREFYKDLRQEYREIKAQDKLAGIETQLKILPSLINMSPNTTEQVFEATIESDKVPDSTETITTPSISEFEKFTEDNLDKIKIPEIEHASKELDLGIDNTQPIEKEIQSNLFEKVLSNDITNFENMINAIHSTPGWTLKHFIASIKTPMGMKEEFSYLPNISNEDEKALAFIAQVAFKTTLRKYVDYNEVVDSSFGILRYNTTTCDAENLDLAYDLLTIVAYIHRVRERLESISADGFENKSILYAASRCFIDPLIFSFIIDKPSDIIKSCVMSRYRHYKEKGFFQKFDDLINTNITDTEMETFISKISTVDSIPVDEVYNLSYNNDNIKVPYKNDYTLEQITNKIVEEHVIERLKPLTKTNKAQDIKPTRVQHKTEKTTYNSNIHRVICSVDYIKQIPERFKAEFIEFITTLKDDYDFKSTTFPAEELGDDIIKALKVWNDSDKKESYTNFRSQLEQCIMTKDTILTTAKADDGTEADLDFSKFVI